VEIGNLVHAVTCSSESLTQLVKTYFPDKIVEHVPDRLNFSLFPPSRKPHQGAAKSVVWFGFIHNAHETLPSLLPTLSACGVKLRIISDKPYTQQDGILALEPEWELFDPATAYHRIQEADMVLNPRSNRAFYRYKSQNKTVIGWKLGLPVAVTSEDLLRFMDPLERNREVQEKREVVERDYPIEQSARQYREILYTIRERYL
jgi:hypothetical protein